MRAEAGGHIRPYISPAIPDGMEEENAAERGEDPQRICRLVGLAREGDRDAFGELYRIHHAAVYRVARFGLPTAAVDDAVAETFLRAWTALPRYRDTGAPFAAWLYGIARHVVTDVHRRAKRFKSYDEVPDRPIRFDLAETDRLTLAAALRKLPNEQRRVIELKFLLGLDNPAVARALGKSIGAVNAMQWRALARLRRIIGDT